MEFNNYIFRENPSASSVLNKLGSCFTSRGLAAYILGVVLVVIYILIYFFPELLTDLITLFDPISMFLKGKPADRWFMYGVLYTIAIIVMGIRMIRKHWGNNYQVFRTSSVIFFKPVSLFCCPSY